LRAKNCRMRTLIPSLLSLSLLLSACSTNNVTIDNSLGRFFDSARVKGTFALFDNGQGHFTIYNLPGYRDSAYIPGETFDIVQSLAAFQTGIVKDDKEIMLSGDSAVVDTATGEQTATVKAHYTLAEAFQKSGDIVNNIVYGILMRRLGADTLRKWTDSLHYGNVAQVKDTSLGFIDLLRISPDEQLGLIKKLYFDQLPFFPRSQELVRNMMNKEENSSYKLDYKVARVLDIYPTDSTRKEWKGPVMGWVVGWVEENKHPYFFVLNFDDPDYRANVNKVGLQLLKNILASRGFFQGTR
jgi:beta-lactamase class D